MRKHGVVVFSVVSAQECVSPHITIVWCTCVEQVAVEKYRITWKEIYRRYNLNLGTVDTA